MVRNTRRDSLLIGTNELGVNGVKYEELPGLVVEVRQKLWEEIIFSPLVHSTGLCLNDHDFLETRVTFEEVKIAVWDCGSNKSPGPDGFSFAFIKKYWDLLKKDIFEFVDSFLASGMMPQCANSSFFTLIPKPIRIFPIKQVIDRIVSKEQSTFIAGQQILDGPLSLSEKNLDFVLLSLGFGSKWRSWIRVCLHSSRASILINGSPTSEFSIKHVSTGLIRGIKIGSSNITLSHLFYADDVIITSDWNSGDLDNIIRVLYVFYLASGLKINIHKSNIFGIGIPNGDVVDMARRTGCASGNFPFTYLGLPIGSNMNLVSSWQFLIDRFHTKLSSWKANLLSIGGRLTLIKAVLGSLGIYFLSIFKAPKTILKYLERYRAKFFWGGSQDSRKLAWIKWSNALSSFDKGGLNIGSLKAFNLALLQKWRWRLFRLDLDKDCLIIDCISNGQWKWNWSREDIGVRNKAYLRELLLEISLVDIIVEEDSCVWDMAIHGIFPVGDTRHLIDAKILPTLVPPTS
ncbi:hypothetical protein Tco_1249312 [Tanacetum coccineum]